MEDIKTQVEDDSGNLHTLVVMPEVSSRKILIHLSKAYVGEVITGVTPVKGTILSRRLCKSLVKTSMPQIQTTEATEWSASENNTSPESSNVY